MIKFILAARRKPGDTQERYFYEWGIIHVALMLTTPAVMETFRRYVQHYSIAGVTNDVLIHPLSDMGWDNMADHWLESTDDFAPILHSQAYVERMQPHKFGDDAFNIELTSGDVVYEQDGFTPGGVKLIHFLKRKPGVSQDDFVRIWRERHAPALLEAARGLLRKYVQNPQLPLDASTFEGTLFELGGVGEYAGIEELWFDSLDDLARLRADSAIYDAIRVSEAAFIDDADTFSMVTTERVVYDFTHPTNPSPKPAVLDPASLEALVDAQGYRDWNVPPGPHGR